MNWSSCRLASLKTSLTVNWGMAAITGVFWYGQFFFYNLGHVRMGHYKFTSWAIHADHAGTDQQPGRCPVA